MGDDTSGLRIYIYQQDKGIARGTDRDDQLLIGK